MPSEVNLNKSLSNFESQSNNIEILFLGHSYPYYGINPDCVDTLIKYKSHNFAFANEQIRSTFYKITSYLNQDKLNKLKLVVINLSQSSLFGQTSTLSTSYAYGRYYDFFDIGRHNADFLLPSIYSLSALYRVKMEKEAVVKNIWHGYHENEIILKNGYSRRDYILSDETFKNETNTFIQWETEKDFTLNYTSINYLKRLLAELKDRNIKVIFIIMPTPVLFLSDADIAKAQSLKKDIDFKEHKTVRIIKGLFPDIPVYNYFDDANGLSLNMFSDRGHFNDKGAKCFSAKLAYDLEQYLSKTGNKIKN